jgi:phospholipid/cholesterol/gamma-HCH transport system substrate-binding protein
VRFHVEETIAVPEGSQTSLSGFAALGSMYMDIELGPQGNERIREGGFIPSSEGGSLLESMTARAPALADNLESVLTNANRTLLEAEVLFRDSNPGVQQTLRAYRQSGEALEELIRSERQNISAALVGLRDFSGDMSRFSDASADSLSIAVQKLNRSMTSLEATLASLDASTKTLDGILGKIDEGDGTMARLINDPSVYQKLDSTLTLLNGLIEEVKNDPKKYLKHMSLVDIF